ncbi:MAG TPA: branched-chain amino acid ABC transporter substrate-binding protein [Chloroflexi bacterium]|nr:branched-chain amino acid ABC transporter substrate-binding protein [Chloroflexota bacterium]
MNRKLSAVLTIVLLSTLVVTACGGGGGAKGGPIKVGAIFDLTGPTSDVGTPYSEGVRDYVEWLNGKGGVEGRTIELIFQDYAYKVDQAEQLYSQYVQEGVVAFMGWGTGDTEALRGRIAEDKIPFMSASYSANLAKIDEAPYNFLVGTTYSDQFIIVLQWILDDWKAKGMSGNPKVVLFHHDSPFGLSPWEDGKAFGEPKGIEMMELAQPKGATDFTAELTRIRDFGANYVVMQTVSSPAAMALKNAQSLGMTDEVQFICLNWCADEILINLAKDAAEGVIGAMPFTPPSVSVPGMKDADEFLKGKGSSLQEKGLHYIQGWWTMAVMTEGIRKVVKDGKEVNGENIRAALESLQNFDTGGVTAPVSFSPTDHRGTKSLRLFKVENGQWVQLTDYISVPGG